jgi:hypothetical protein
MLWWTSGGGVSRCRMCPVSMGWIDDCVNVGGGCVLVLDGEQGS